MFIDPKNVPHTQLLEMRIGETECKDYRDEELIMELGPLEGLPLVQEQEHED